MGMPSRITQAEFDLRRVASDFTVGTLSRRLNVRVYRGRKICLVV